MRPKLTFCLILPGAISFLCLSPASLSANPASPSNTQPDKAQAAGKPGAAPTVDEAKWKQIEKMMGRKVNRKPHNLEPITVTGEIIDVWCFMSETMGPGRGEKHKACATACGHGGMPLGIVEDKTGQVYVAAKSPQPYKGCNDMLLPYIAQKVTIEGFVARKGGCQVLRVQKVSPAK